MEQNPVELALNNNAICQNDSYTISMGPAKPATSVADARAIIFVDRNQIVFLKTEQFLKINALHFPRMVKWMSHNEYRDCNEKIL